MFRRIHSNRDPNDTLFSEIKKEFGVYFGKAESNSKAFLERHTRPVFRLMVGSLFISLVLSLTLFRYHAPPSKSFSKAAKPVARKAAVISDGFSRIMQVGSALREMIALKKQVDSITNKKVLTPQDSLVLEHDLDRLQQIIKSTKIQTNGH